MNLMSVIMTSSVAPCTGLHGALLPWYMQHGQIFPSSDDYIESCNVLSRPLKQSKPHRNPLIAKDKWDSFQHWELSFLFRKAGSQCRKTLYLLVNYEGLPLLLFSVSLTDRAEKQHPVRSKHVWEGDSAEQRHSQVFQERKYI